MATVPVTTIEPPLVPDRVDALNSVAAELDREQLLWSSGYLAGMAAVGASESKPTATHTVPNVAIACWSIFYATETGNCRRLAESLAEHSRDAGFIVDVHDLRDYRPRALSRVENALFVIATHGIGEAPEGSEVFFEYWLSDKAPRLEQLHYSILALGDSSYADFCEMGQILDKRLNKLGASCVVDRVDCDLDFDRRAADWTGQVVNYAREQSDVAATKNAPYLRSVTQAASFTRERPFNAEILSQQKITAIGSSKDVQHIELKLQGSGLSYEPGDSLGVIPQNPAELVSALLTLLQLEGTEEVAIEGNFIALSDALTKDKEITALSRPFLDVLAPEHEKLQEIVTDRDKLTDLFKTRQLIDVVDHYPRAWQAQELVDALRKLTPRLYSIASSPDASPDEAHLTVGVVRYKRFGRWHWGSASTYLVGGVETVPVYVEPNDHFRLPLDGDTPIIMIGAGTGVAPYRAFVEHRREHGHSGDNWLVFGDRNRSSDFLYQLEWLRYRKDGTLKHLDVVFSRDQQEKLYVQHRVFERAKEIYAWLENGAHIYVCGDAEGMAVDVNEALLSVVQTAGGMSDAQSTQHLSDLKSAHRYQRDVY